MAIQEIEVSKKGSDTTGFKREIDEGAMGLVLDTIQITQYTKPEESTVRELTANAVDSQREKEIAISILSGESTPEEHFIEREGAKYKDSNWDASYYDLSHLDASKTKVELIYEQNEGLGHCDRFIVRDYGVGLGKERLEGYFSIGYSTKRNSKGSLGAFGFGNKVALSTRCDYYTVTTVHNGKKFKFNCFSYKIDSVIGKFSGDTVNESITFNNGEEVYYEATEEANYTEIVVPTKRHHRSKYIQAVKSQLLYFSTVTFKVIEEDRYEREVDVAADILYNSDRLIISRNYQFSKPHIVIVKGEEEGEQTGVCYGYIDFQEMEMEQLYGNVGVKCPIRSVIRDEETGQETVLQEGVEVTPSRETVIWSEHTRNFIKNAFAEAVEEASDLVTAKLKETDFLRWVNACKDALTHTGGDSVISQLSKVIDMNSIRPKFTDTKIAYTAPDIMFRGFKARYSTTVYDSKKQKNVTHRRDISSWADFNHRAVYLKTGRTDSIKDAYIHSIRGTFTTIEMLSDEELESRYVTNEVESKNLSEKLYQEMLVKRQAIWDLIESSNDVKHYEDIEVPEDFGKQQEEEEKQGEINALSAAERRRIESKIVIHGLFEKKNPSWGGSNDKRFVWKQKDTKVSDILEDEATIYYGTSQDDANLHLIGYFMHKQCPDKWDVREGESYWQIDHLEDRNIKFFNDKIKIIKINKSNEKYFKGRPNCIHANDFFVQTTDING